MNNLLASDQLRKNNQRYQKILLMLLPFHPPLIPPLGMACLKSFLQPHGYSVKTIDANLEEELREYYSHYFQVLGEHIPPHRQANFYNIGNELLRNHMMACIHYENENEYRELVKKLINKTFFCDFSNVLVDQLNAILERYYSSFKTYLLKVLDKEKPDVLGLSIFKGTIPSSLFAFRLAREIYPGILTVMGGGVLADQLAEGSPELEFFIKKTPYIDKILIGEGENLFLKLLQGQLPGSRKVYTLKDLQPHFVDLSSVNIPDFSDYDVGSYPYLANYTSRSCPFQCTFCGETIFWGTYRKKKPEQVVNEMRELYTKYKRQLYLMCDSLLNPTLDKLTNGLAHHGLPVYFDGYLRIDPPVCRRENTLRWRQGGYYRARLGVESGSQRILDLMHKKITIEQIKSAVASLANAGIKTTTYWIVGYPGETEEDFQQTLDLIEEMQDDIYEAEANPFWYYLNALVKSHDWAKHCETLYPEKAREMLILQTRVLNIPPLPEERFVRLCRFVKHCHRLGIPNPYSLSDIYQADQRWNGLHKNAVPPLNDFYQSKVTDPLRGIYPPSSISRDKPPAWRLPGDYESGKSQGKTVQNVSPPGILQFIIASELAGKLQETAVRENTSRWLTMLAILNTWLAIIANQDIITVGAAFPGHPLRPVTLDLTGNPDCRQILDRILQPAANDHGYSIIFAGYESLPAKTLITGLTPLSQLVNDSKNKENEFIECNYTLELDLLMEMVGEGDEIRLFIGCDHRRYRKETMERYFNRFSSILEAFLNSPGFHLSQLRSLDLDMAADEMDELF
jgi:radical SAM superfamily enzyme YgiQ (UPF0313 family)